MAKTIKTENTTYAHVKALAIKNEGIVFMGCGGSKDKWITDVTNDLIKEKVLPKDTKAEDVWESPIYVFQATDGRGRTDMLFLWKPTAKLDFGKMAIWRIKLGFARWLRDYTQEDTDDGDDNDD